MLCCSCQSKKTYGEKGHESLKFTGQSLAPSTNKLQRAAPKVDNMCQPGSSTGGFKWLIMQVILAVGGETKKTQNFLCGPTRSSNHWIKV
mmetsp:Transcript_56815/g.120842  ORF Transcript_56815/g.120842 Transcript_56815/m.120842 type:complete len:90 (+) Transcript_56815:152-421(+)